MITILIGKSASGKDTLLNKLIKHADVEPVISYTTRPKRSNEVDGKDYNFISKKAFKELIDSDNLTEWRKYNTLVNGRSQVWYYGTPLLSMNKNYVVVLDVNGAKRFVEKYGSKNCEVIYLDVPENIRHTRAKSRDKNFDETEWNRRAKDDEIKFAQNKIIAIKEMGVEVKIIKNY